jgi:uncharacterized RDD family membrane protein YckC
MSSIAPAIPSVAGAASSLNPYAAPRSAPSALDTSASVAELAPRSSRFLAVLTDLLVLVLPTMASALIAPAMVELGGDVGAVLSIVSSVLLGLLFIGLLVTNLVWLHRYGQTIGKRLLKVRIVRTDGSRISLARVVFLRGLPLGLVGAIPVLGQIVAVLNPLMIFRSDRRCLHDLIADSKVVNA